MSTDGSQSDEQPKPRKVFGNAAGHRQAQQAVQNPVQAQQPVQPVVQPPVQPVVQQPVQPALVRRQAFINRLANAQPNQNPVLGGALGHGRAQAQQAVVNNQAPVQQAPVQQPVVNQPPVRPVGQSPQIPPPKLLRERSEKEMKESQKQHNLDRMQKLNNLSAGADIYCTNYSSKLAKGIKSPGQHFQAVTQSLQACEAKLTAANLNTLKADAQSCLSHLNQQGAMAKLAPEYGAKKLACEQLLERIPQAECRITLEALGPADAWGLAEENTAASVYSKLLFEAGDSVVKPGDKKKAPSRTMAKPNVAEGKTTANASWWVEKQVGDGDKGKKKFIFKPAELGDQIAGFPDGGSPCREVLGKAVANQLQACMGIDFGAPETLLVNVAKDRLAGYEGGDPSQSETVGSMQHFSKSDGEFGDLIEKDPTLLQRISKEDCQKMAVLDLVSLNMDRHSGNFMVAGAQGAQPKLIPIDHGLVMPSRAGLRERATRLGPPNTALSKIPASEDPFTPEMAARVAAIDPDEVVKGLRATQQVMQGQHKAVADKADIKDENFNLVKRSCEFLKAGVAAGLSPAELSDAYLRHQDSIFDTPDDNTKPAAFARVIADVQAKSPMRQKALKALPTPDHCIPVADELVKLGWDVPSFTKEAKPEAKAGLFQMILTNPLLYDMQQNKTPNPFLQQEIDDLEQQCIAEGIDVVAKKNAKGNDVPMAYRKTLMNNLSSTQLRKRNAQADLDAKALPGGVFAKNTHKEIYAECFLADGGAAKLANASGDPMENLKAYMDAEEQRWNLSGLAKKFNESFPEEEEDTAQPTKVDNGSGDGAKANATTDASPNAVTIKRCKRFKMMRAFAQYEAEGGNSDYEALGCDKSIPYDSPSARLKELRSAKKLKAQLKALEDLAKPKAATATAQPVQPAQQNQPVQPKATDKRQAVKDVSTRAEVLNKRIAVLEPVMRDNLMKRLLAAMRTGTGGELDEALRLIGELEEELDVQEASSTS